MAKLSTTIAGLTFPNPVMPGAGPNVADGMLLQAAAQEGAGGLVTHTVSVLPAPNLPPYKEVRGGLLNNQLWSDKAVEEWIEHDYVEARAAADAAGIPLIINIGYTAEEVANLAPRVAPFADAVELTMHFMRESGGIMDDPVAAAEEGAQLLSSYLSRSTKPLTDAIQAAKAALDVPVFVKLNPLGGGEMAAVAKACEAAGADAIVAVNSFGPCFSIDLETGESILEGGDGQGWLSGTSLRALAMRCIFDMAREIKIPIIGSGGISRGVDAIETMMAGASAVQVCTQALKSGPKAYGRVAREIDKWLEKHGYSSVDEIIGLGVERWESLQPHDFSVPILYQEDECIGCNLCELSCHYDAIYMVGKLAEFNPERCFGCGLCVVRCPNTSLLMPQVTKDDQVIHPLSGEPVGMLRAGAGHLVETT